MNTGTHKLGATLALVAAAAALSAAPAAAGDEGRYGPADGWAAGVVGSATGANADSQADSVPVDSRQILSRTGAYGAPDGWTARAVEGRSSLPPDSRPVSFGAADGWTARALDSSAVVRDGGGPLSLGPQDGWTTRAFEGAGSLPPDSRPVSFGAPDGWTARAVTPSVSFSAAPASATAGGFDWMDAGVGAGATLAALLLIGLAAGFVRHSRMQPRGRLAGS